MATFITRMTTSGDGTRVAVKDIIDVEGVPTTAGCKAVELTAKPAVEDAACLAGFRAAGARLVGKANLHELAMLPIGTNPWFGNPTNPIDAALIPGGSSSGSAVAVATDEADVALGSDTGGSVRVPSACCGTSGLKTTFGRVPVDGVYPLAPSLDTIGPMGVNIASLVAGMQLLEPGFSVAPSPARRVGRLRTTGHPDIERAIDDALERAELEVVDLDWDGIEAGTNAFTAIFFSEIYDTDHALVEADPSLVGPDIVETLALSEVFRPGLPEVQAQLEAWRAGFQALFDQVEVLALPTMPIFPPTIEHMSNPDTFVSTLIEITANVSLFNVAGNPCTAQPVPVLGSKVPASIQLVGPIINGEELLLPTAQLLEDALR